VSQDYEPEFQEERNDQEKPRTICIRCGFDEDHCQCDPGDDED
jgi:hypothetical protein